MAHDIIDIEVRVIRKTDMAALVKDERGEKVWLPLSKIEIQPPEGSRVVQTISLPEWLALDKGLI